MSHNCLLPNAPTKLVQVPLGEPLEGLDEGPQVRHRCYAPLPHSPLPLSPITHYYFCCVLLLLLRYTTYLGALPLLPIATYLGTLLLLRYFTSAAYYHLSRHATSTRAMFLARFNALSTWFRLPCNT